MARGGFYSVDSLRGVHVLVVDYEADCRDLLFAVLREDGAPYDEVVTPATTPGVTIFRRMRCWASTSSSWTTTTTRANSFAPFFSSAGPS